MRTHQSFFPLDSSRQQNRVSVAHPARSRFRPFLWVTTLLAWSASGALAASTYSSLVVFGDSLSDNGNAAYIFQTFPQFIPTGLPAPQPSLYTAGRYTNGSDVTPGTAYQGTWVEQLSSKLSLPDPTPGLPNFLNSSLPPGTNLAVAGSNTNDGSPVSIDAMVQAYLLSQGGTLSASPLYILFGGANDVFRATDPSAAAQAAVTNIFQDVQLLAAAGARHFLVPNLPDLGTTPRAVQTGEASALSAASLVYASAWSAALTNAQNSGENVMGVDLYTLYAGIEANPAAYGLSNVSTPAQGQSVAVDSYLFWDIQHPTTAGHQLIAEAAFDALNPISPPTPVPEPAVLPLAASGFAILLLAGLCRSGKSLLTRHKPSCH